MLSNPNSLLSTRKRGQKVEGIAAPITNGNATGNFAGAILKRALAPRAA